MPKLPLFVIHIIVIRSTAVFQVKPIITLHKCDILLEVIWKIALDFLFHRYVANCFPHHGYIWNYGAIPQVRIDPAPDAWGLSNPFYVNVISSSQYKAAQCLTFVIDRHGKTPTTRTHRPTARATTIQSMFVRLDRRSIQGTWRALFAKLCQ